MLNYSESEGKTYVKINNPMGLGDEMIFPGDLEDSCNMVSFI